MGALDGYISTHMHVCMRKSESRTDQRLVQSIFLSHSPPHSFETGSLNEPDAQLSARLVGQRVPGIFLPLLHVASRSSVPSLHTAVQEEGA